jgi:hypothetical protein
LMDLTKNGIPITNIQVQFCSRVFMSSGISGDGQDHQYGGSRKEQVAPSAPEKLR